LENAEIETGTTTSCVAAYLNRATTWAQWESPWITAPWHGYTTWVAAEPLSRQLTLEVDLMPDSLENLWATCFANEVTAMRQATGEHFLFDWNPNACYESVPYANYYPGNAYVDILGLDLYDGT